MAVGIVEQLVEEATRADASVAGMLRKLKVIAARTKAGALGEWVDHELSGYPVGTAVPPYRGPFDLQVLGSLSGPFGTGFENAPIPSIPFPEKYHDSLFRHTFREPVAELEGLAANGGNLRIAWPADAIAMAQHLSSKGSVRINPTLVLNAAYKAVSPSMLAGILDAIRSRILDLALTFEVVAPSVGEEGDKVVSSGQVTNIFHTQMFGTSSNVAIGSTNVHQTADVSVRGDESTLLKSMRAAGATDTELAELSTALRVDRDENGGVTPAEPGPEVSRWWSRWSLKAASAAGQIGTGLASGVAAQAINAYFGLA
ncbi:hypothetical protein ACFFX1_34945 [Dactylosporangium sucinum]|uniref:AbiTii domain-containing protein n=1 Tax=Dactylosporangium sucinum TaxID=1424081 RepID=A0A917X107_9ACTN|nr:hypothetical protein [Dactylosporangium sucinum]GGM50481.1 hypothetical protein GCM10007977_060270 [Dactylosporangium sucinum]